MKKNIISLLLVTLVTLPVCAQKTQENQSGKITASFDWLGAGFMLGNSNLSPYGAHYRKNVTTGMTVNFKLGYLSTRNTYLGIKYNIFTAADNYALKSGASVADDLTLHYIAPQIGFARTVNKRLLLTYTIGAGYLSYHNKSLLDATDQKYTASMVGANLDVSLTYPIVKGLNMGINASMMTTFDTSKLSQSVADTKQTIRLENRDKMRMNRIDWHLVLQMVW
jgi:hypothetical protein